jgi:hypothetical protein
MYNKPHSKYRVHFKRKTYQEYREMSVKLKLCGQDWISHSFLSLCFHLGIQNACMFRTIFVCPSSSDSAVHTDIDITA